MDRYGQDKVEDFIDNVLSLENLLDINVLFETQEVRDSRREANRQAIAEMGSEHSESDERSQALRSFMKSKLNPNREAKKNLSPDEEEQLQEGVTTENSSPRDIMRFILENAPLKEWEADILAILREEAYYFLPQRLTKIMNEGWASYWHSKIMTKKVLKASEIIDFADHHAGVMAMSKQNINPYKIGIELFRDIEYRWDTGKYGKEYQECTNMAAKQSWDLKLGGGREKIFEVRKTHNDITFIDEFFTEEFCERQQLFTYKYNPRTGRYEIDTRDFEDIKSKLLSQLTNFGQPLIEIETGNFSNRGELLLKHIHQGVDLDMSFAAETMKNVYALWKRPINLLTVQEEVETTYVFDGKELKPLS